MSTSSCEIIHSKRIVCFGDSVTQGVPHCAPDDTFARVLERRLNMKYSPRLEVCAFNAGVGGENSREGLARITTDVLSHKPDLVTIEFGLNDIRYEPEKEIFEEQFAANLRQMRTILVESGTTVLFMTPTPIVNLFHVYSQGTNFYDRWGGCEGRNAIYAEVIREVAADLGDPLADIHQVFLREAIKAEFLGETFNYSDLSSLSRYISARDGVHPTASGQQLIAEELYRVIVTQDLLTSKL